MENSSTLESEQAVNLNEQSALTVIQIQQKREQVLNSINNIRLLPENWRSQTGKNRHTIIEYLESYLNDLTLLEARTAQKSENIEANTQIEKVPTESNEKIRKAHTSEIIKETRCKVNQVASYINIDNIYIPVCELVENKAEWKTIPGKMVISGGQKFSEVRFIKDSNGLTYTAKPGELLDFSEKYRDKRLESIDTILAGRNELKVFKELLEHLGKLTREYEDLNPDEENYNKNASHLADKIEKFTDPDKILKIFDLKKSKIDEPEDFAEKFTDIIRTLNFLQSIDESGFEFIPKLDPKFKLTPFFKERFRWFASLLNRQLGLGNNSYLKELVKNQQTPNWEQLSAKGMTIMVGPRGTGKNKITDYYCSITNRPLFRYACSPDKEERDLTYDVELSDGEVARIPTRILTAITTPNAMLELDEINLLRPNIAKFFNSLFDGDRTIFLNDQVIKAASGVLFVGLMNPADYDGVEDLPETIDDRSNIMTVKYPPLREINSNTNEEKFTYDEALILKENIYPLEKLSDDEFIKAWDYIINQKSAHISLESTIIRILKDLKKIVSISDRTRQVVAAYKTRTGDMRMERDISLRGSIEASRFYSENHLWKVNHSKMTGWKSDWNAAQYAIAMTYLPHTNTYKRGTTDRYSMDLILAEQIN